MPSAFKLWKKKKKKHENQTIKNDDTAGKAPFPGLNNTVTSIPAWAEVHYWDTNLLTSSVRRKKKKKKNQKNLVLCPYQFHSRNSRDMGSFMWGAPKISYCSLCRKTLLKTDNCIPLPHVSYRCIIKGKNKPQRFFWGQLTAQILAHYVLHQPHCVL